MTDWNPFKHHRGPYRLIVIRPRPEAKKKTPWTSQRLGGTCRTQHEVEEEVEALLTDPRDTIETVMVFSVKEQKMVMAYRRKPS